MKCHFIGVAGVGMSAVAQAALSSGWQVSGSDRVQSLAADSAGAGSGVADVLRKLKNVGISLHAQDGSGVTADLDAVVVSTAIEDDNPDLLAAKSLDIEVLHRSEMLAKLISGKQCLAIAGTSGKSTVTGMIGCMLSELGADPTVVNGAPVVNWVSDENVGNVRTGESDFWIIEADESDRSLLNYNPEWAVVTNISADHFSLEETQALFEEFCGNVVDWIIDCATAHSSVPVNLSVPGDHNVENANMAVSVARLLGYSESEAVKALESFQGISRRFELLGKKGGVAVIDDYAHNPAKIEASLLTARQEYGKVIGVWRPHGYGPLRKMMDHMVQMFTSFCSDGDKVFIMPVYDAGGTADRTVNSDELVRRLVEKGINAEYVEETDVVKAASEAAGDVVLVMGARDPGLTQMAHDILESLD